MTTEMTTPKQTAVLDDIAGFEGFSEAVQTAASDRPTGGPGAPLLRMGTDGIWLYGAENTEVQEGSRWAIDPRSLARGYVCWTRWSREELKAGKRNQLMGEVFVPMSVERPDRAHLPEHINEDTGQPWPWADAMSVVMTCQNGEDRGLQVLYKVSSVGGLRALNNLLDEVQVRMKTGDVVPEITLSNDHYDHRDYGKTYVPEFDYVAWRVPGPGCGIPGDGMGLIDYEQSGDVIEDQTEPSEDEAPKARARKRPAA